MKIVINTCFGGFSLSALAVRRLAELQGKLCYFFIMQDGKYKPSTIEDLGRDYFSAFSVPDPDPKVAAYMDNHLSSRPDDRTDPLLIQVVEEIKERADGPYAKLKIVEIPEGVDWEIDEYDGSESVHEKHRSWS